MNEFDSYPAPTDPNDPTEKSCSCGCSCMNAFVPLLILSASLIIFFGAIVWNSRSNITTLNENITLNKPNLEQAEKFERSNQALFSSIYEAARDNNEVCRRVLVFYGPRFRNLAGQPYANFSNQPGQPGAPAEGGAPTAAPAEAPANPSTPAAPVAAPAASAPEAPAAPAPAAEPPAAPAPAAPAESATPAS